MQAGFDRLVDTSNPRSKYRLPYDANRHESRRRPDLKCCRQDRAHGANLHDHRTKERGVHDEDLLDVELKKHCF